MTYPDPNQPHQYPPQDQNPPQNQYPPQGYAPQGYAPQGFPPPQPVESGERRNIVGIIALAASIIGFIFACIPGALIVGWVLLPIAFILGIVGVCLAGLPKKASIAAIILSVVGTIVGFVVFLTAVGDAVDEAFTPDAATVVDDGEEQPADVGTRRNPARIGATLSGREWTVVVNSFDRDATDEVMAANQFNDEPPAGREYALVNLTVKYTGDDSSYADFVTVTFVADSGKTYSTSDSMAVAPEPRLGGELYTGGSTTGNVDIAIPTDEPGVLRISMGFNDEAFVAVN